jgi:D-alanyl-D-alanine carboxypeptidase
MVKQAVWFATLVLAACRHGGAGGAGVAASSGGGVDPAPPPAPAPSFAPTATPALVAAPATPNPFPFGPPTGIPQYTCPVVLRGGPFRRYMAPADTRVAFVDGDDLLALVNRSPTGALPPDYAPRDLVDLKDGSARTAARCDGRLCLRHDAAEALHAMLDRMRADGVEGHISSAYRGFGTQCWVFSSWAHQAHGGFCEATEQSALPGHSQHQLGTTVDLFTRAWAAEGAVSGKGVFRNGFGCSTGGRWIDENAWTFGFVVSYPIDPDDRREGSRCVPRSDRSVPIDPKTGYKSEPWHVRFIGVDAAAQFHSAWQASGPGTPDEITLEQWLRSKRGLLGDTELPVCDGCHCGACATMADDDRGTPCGEQALRLDDTGKLRTAPEEPRVVDAQITSAGDAVTVDVTVHVGPHTPTQTPVTTDDGPSYGADATYESLAPYPESKAHRYPDLPGAWRVAVEPVPEAPIAWPWRASLAKPELAEVWNRANLVLPARGGDVRVRVRAVPPAGTRKLRITVLRDGVEHETREVDRP